MPQDANSLKKSITWVQGTAMTIGAVLGSGVLILPVLTAVMAGPASLISWVVMGVITIPLAMTLGSLAASHPHAGGIAHYGRQAFGPRVGKLVGWLLLGTIPVGSPVTALIGANFIGAFFGLSDQIDMGIAVIMLVLALFFNYRGIELSAKIQFVIISSIALILSAAVVAALPLVRRDAFLPFAPVGWVPVGQAMVVLFWAFVGWEMVVPLAEEFTNPRRDIPLSLSVSIVLVNMLYISLAVVTIGTRSYVGSDATAALARMIEAGWGNGAGAVTAVLAFLVCYGTIHTYVAGFSRMVFAQAREGNFPAVFSKLHPQFQTPYRVFLVLIPIFAITLSLKYWLGLPLTVLIQGPSTIFIILYIIAMGAAVRLLPERSGKGSAAAALFLCIIIYCFSGQAGLYPVFVALIGWGLSKIGRR